MLGNNDEGSWFVDPVLRLAFAEPDTPPHLAKPLRGAVLESAGPATAVAVEVDEQSGQDRQSRGAATVATAGAAGSSGARAAGELHARAAALAVTAGRGRGSDPRAAAGDVTFTTTGSAAFRVVGTVGSEVGCGAARPSCSTPPPSSPRGHQLSGPRLPLCLRLLQVHTVEATLSAVNVNAVGLELSTSVGAMDCSTASGHLGSDPGSGNSSAATDAAAAAATYERAHASAAVAGGAGSTGGLSRVDRRYPYEVVSSYRQTADDFEIYGYVKNGAEVNVTTGADAVAAALSFSFGIESNATYNRTNDYVYNQETDQATEVFVAQSPATAAAGGGSSDSHAGSTASCTFEQRLEALDGYVTAAAEGASAGCAADPVALGLQRQRLCAGFDVCAPAPANLTGEIPGAPSAAWAGEGERPLLVRTPWRRSSGPEGP